jgi:hypothetical protein
MLKSKQFSLTYALWASRFSVELLKNRPTILGIAGTLRDLFAFAYYQEDRQLTTPSRPSRRLPANPVESSVEIKSEELVDFRQAGSMCKERAGMAGHNASATWLPKHE